MSSRINAVCGNENQTNLSDTFSGLKLLSSLTTHFCAYEAIFLA